MGCHGAIFKLKRHRKQVQVSQDHLIYKLLKLESEGLGWILWFGPEMSVIAEFHMKTGGSMFVGFDSQNTSHSFLTIPIGICGFVGFLCLGPEVTQGKQ